MTFRQERHKLFSKAIEQTINDTFIVSADSDKARAAKALPLAFDLYKSIIDIPFGDIIEGRTTRDILISAIRQIAVGANRSWFYKTAMRMLGLQPIIDALDIYGLRVTEFTRSASLLAVEEAKYDKFLLTANKIATEFGGNITNQCRLYASLKTWKDDESLVRTHKLLETYTFGKHELIIEGPIKLLIQISEEGFLLIWRALTWQGGRDEPRLQEAEYLATELYGILRKQDGDGFIREFSDLLVDSIHAYCNMWLSEQMKLRSWVPEDSKDRFFHGFEHGFYSNHCLEE